jgi:hypothetical protein
MALITRRQFVQQAAFSASALRYSFHHFERAHILQQGKAKSAPVDVESIRKMASKISGHVITPDASGYESARHVNNHAYDRHPAVITGGGSASHGNWHCFDAGCGERHCFAGGGSHDSITRLGVGRHLRQQFLTGSLNNIAAEKFFGSPFIGVGRNRQRGQPINTLNMAVFKDGVAVHVP